MFEFLFHIWWEITSSSLGFLSLEKQNESHEIWIWLKYFKAYHELRDRKLEEEIEVYYNKTYGNGPNGQPVNVA